MDKLPISEGRDAVRKALGLDGSKSINKSFHQNPDGTLMETEGKSLSEDQLETIQSEMNDLNR